MAVRLPVVLSQSARRSPKHSDVEEEWIAKLLFEARLDATLLSDLSAIPNSSTDRLCLEGIKGDFVLLTWLSIEETNEWLAKLALFPYSLRSIVDGEIRQTGGDVPGIKKKVYYLQLSTLGAVDEEIARLKKLLASLSTPVFQLGGFAQAPPPAPKPTSEQNRGPGVSPEITPPRAGRPCHVESSTPIQNVNGQNLSSQNLKESRDSVEPEDSEFPDIDILMKELDELDL